MRPATLLKMRPWDGRFPVNFTRFLITTFSRNAYRATASASFEPKFNFTQYLI